MRSEEIQEEGRWSKYVMSLVVAFWPAAIVYCFAAFLWLAASHGLSIHLKEAKEGMRPVWTAWLFGVILWPVMVANGIAVIAGFHTGYIGPVMVLVALVAILHRLVFLRHKAEHAAKAAQVEASKMAEADRYLEMEVSI